MFKAILFDLDNTLIDFLTFKKETAKAAAKAMVKQGLPCTETEVYGKIFSVYDEKGIEYQKTFSDVLKPFNLEMNLAEKIQQAAITAYLQKKFDVLKPYPMVRPTLARLREKGLKLGIVTDAPRNKAWQRLVLAGLENEFDLVITLDDTMLKKPHPSPFYLALQKLNLLAPACLFVGDNPERDIKGAKELGMQTCLAKYGLWHRAAEPKADYEIDKFEDLLKVLG
ncbi:MAG: TIGR02253 family HAD-type hydrolase [Candidatus Micrarchaeota archaeon]|nr:TIGR02253 family HAD-type hydrolase [Candidatus Micrarchaeota archaeon]